MSLADDLRARMRLIPVHWEQHKLYARALTLAEEVEKLPEAAGWIRYAEGVYVPAHRVQAAAVEKLKEMVR